MGHKEWRVGQRGIPCSQGHPLATASSGPRAESCLRVPLPTEATEPRAKVLRPPALICWPRLCSLPCCPRPPWSSVGSKGARFEPHPKRTPFPCAGDDTRFSDWCPEPRDSALGSPTYTSLLLARCIQPSVLPQTRGYGGLSEGLCSKLCSFRSVLGHIHVTHALLLPLSRMAVQIAIC